MTSHDQKLLELRAERLRSAPADRATDAFSTWVAEFKLGGASWAVPLEVLRAAVSIRAVSSVPLAPPPIIGIVRYQGRLLCAYSLAALLGVKQWARDPSIILIVETGGRLVAVDCEEAPRALPLPTRAVDAASSRGDGSRREVIAEGRAPVTLLELELLIPRGSQSHGP
ncbi:MAG: chemotaxis protein CheW [Archangium sp.]|nr:chemotaxis protein CheW [Archangium sp.]